MQGKSYTEAKGTAAKKLNNYKHEKPNKKAAGGFTKIMKTTTLPRLFIGNKIGHKEDIEGKKENTRTDNIREKNTNVRYEMH